MFRIYTLYTYLLDIYCIIIYIKGVICIILTYEITKNDVNMRLSAILKNKLYISTRLLLKLKNNKCIFVNNSPTNADYIVKLNDVVTVNLDNATKTDKKRISSIDIPINILYEDDYILIVDKEAKLAIHPSMGKPDNTLVNRIQNYYDKQNYDIDTVHILTRLDLNTSGICLIAKNEYIQELFLRKKDSINIQKEYIAIVNNILTKDHEILEGYLKRTDGSIITREITNNELLGKYIKTEYYTLERNVKNNYSVIKVILHTGRTHQIRVHFASIGHLLLGDELYYLECLKNNQNGNNNSYIKNSSIFSIHKYIDRHALHCSNLSFIHPILNTYINISSNLPNDMQNLTTIRK